MEYGMKKERILETAVELFGRKGYYKTRMADIASEARMSPKTIYRLFDGKKALFMAAGERATDRLLGQVLEFIPEQDSRESALWVLNRVFRQYISFVRDNRGLARIIADSVAVTDEDIRREHGERMEGVAGIIASVLEGDQEKGRYELITDPEKVAWLFLAFASLVTMVILLDMDRNSASGFDPEYALDTFFRVASVTAPATDPAPPA